MLAERLGGKWEVVRFISVIVIYWGIEAHAVLSGFRILPRSQVFWAFLGWGAGTAIERTVRFLQGKRGDPVRDFSLGMAFGLFYLIPPVLGIVSVAIPYYLPLSIIGFLLLMSRLAWQLHRVTRCIPATSGQ